MARPEASPDCIYKVVSRAAFEGARAAGVFPQMPIDLEDGFIHFSTAAQLRDTLRLHFAGNADLVVFAVPTIVIPDLRWEASRGGQLFPHAYGAVPETAVGQHAPVSVAVDGSVTLPDWIA
jgi:uncharacterized protein (DUF952 family)